MSPTGLDFRLTVTGLMNDAEYGVELDCCVAGVKIASVSQRGIARAQCPHNILGRLRKDTTGTFPPEQLKELGNSLTDLLLPAVIRDAFLAHVRRFPTDPVSIRLKIAPCDMASLPWEFLRLEAAPDIAPNGWLSLNDRFTLRREAGSSAAVPPLPINQLRVLIVWADPCSPRFPALLHRSREVEAIREVLKHQGVRAVTELRHATPENLRKEIRELKPHLLHFIGHGQQRLTGGRLILSGSGPNSEASVAAEDLADWLAETQVRLVTLAACDTLGVAQTLAARGVPAVIAMQMPLSDDLAVVLAQNFYTFLLQPRPVATALAQARRTLRGAGPAWGVPILIESAESDDLFVASSDVEPPFNVTLPRDPEFVGHRALLAEMHRILSDTEANPTALLGEGLFRKQNTGKLPIPKSRSIALFGMGGQGKTQLAAEYAHRYQEDYPGGIFWIKAATTQSVLDDLGLIGRLHFAPPEEMAPHHLAAHVRESLQAMAKPTLLVYDNVAWENENDPTEKTEPNLFLPVQGQCRVIVTTRDRLLAPPLAHIFDKELLLEPADALFLLTQGRALPPEECLEAERILELTGALPLALALAAHHIRRGLSSFKEYREHLEYSRVDTLTRSRRGFISTTKHNGMIFNAIAISYCALEPSHRHVLSVLACFNRQSICPEMAFRASGFRDRMAFHDALADLMDCALLRREEDRRLTLHELVRVFVLGEQTPEELRPAASAVADSLAAPLRRANETMQWKDVRRDLPHCRAVTQVCQRNGVFAPLIGLLLAHGEYLLEHRELALAEECCRAGIALTEHDANHRLDLAHFWRLVGEVRLAAQEPDAYDAVVTAFLIAGQALLPADPEMWHFHNSKGLALKRSNRTSEALACYKEALTLCRLAFGENDERVALLLNNIAALQEMRGDLEACLENYRRSLAIYAGKYGAGHSKTAVRLNNIGRILYASGHFDAARQHHLEALRIHSTTYPETDINVLMSRYYYALAWRALGRNAEAENAYDKAIEGLGAFYAHSDPFYIQLQKAWQKLIDGTAGDENIAPL